MSCYCDGEVYYCENCQLTLSRMEVKERRVLDDIRHHGHDHADCPLCGAELCDAPHVESCNVEEVEFAPLMDQAEIDKDAATGRGYEGLV